MVPTFDAAPTARKTSRAVGAALSCLAATALLATAGCSVGVVEKGDSPPVRVKVANEDELASTPTATATPTPTPIGVRIQAKLPSGPPVTVAKPDGWTRGGHILKKETLFGPHGTDGDLPHVSIEADREKYWLEPAGPVAEFRRATLGSKDKRVLSERRARINGLDVQRFTTVWSSASSGKFYVVEVLVSMKYRGDVHTVTIRGSNAAGKPHTLVDAIVESVKVNGIAIAPVMK